MTPTDRRSFLRTSLGGATALALASELDLAAALFRANAPVSVALVGCGRQGREMLAELAKMENVTVVAVCDTVESRLSSGQRRVRDAKGYATVKELLAGEPGVDAILVATPTHTHREVAEAALAAGKHVYCESPLASTIDDAKAIVRAARASGKVFQTGMLGRVNPIYKLAHKFWKTGSIRNAVALRAQSHDKTSWRVGSDPALNWRLDPSVSLGLIGELGTQQLDVYHWFLEAYPTSVSGRGAIMLHDDGREVHDTVAATFGFESGLTLQYSASIANSFESTYELIEGSMGTMKLAWSWGWLFKEADAATQGWEVYANRQQFHNDEGITLIADATKLAAQDKLKDGVGLPYPPIYYGLESFLKSVTEGAEVQCSAEEGLRAAAVAIVAKRAIDSGDQLTIEPGLFEV
ncbi:Gfo/Idh/MocA family protein [Engelhardtia mirabilis]|uniref:1,5-anhydro-D-fructose reductase n=1 Tax=Engelhardtia mirabilis TaxID=2528011 RepID=A0A518BHH2_9BACT|nr:1,5-anhydro-D-fructose reductase [Planctomycetes bacterium Pla133]QDV00755.1 1,5-anhydro-D-fructose reductase [Planctomycetes bacterium Pla86]